MSLIARRGFALIEVVMALGVLALAVISLLAFLASAAGAEGEMADAQAAASLGGPVQAELERLQAELGFDGLAAAVPPAGSPAPLRLVATRDGRRALRADGAAAAADRPLNDPTLPGIARRDRYFLVEITRQLDLPDGPAAGSFYSVSFTPRGTTRGGSVVLACGCVSEGAGGPRLVFGPADRVRGVRVRVSGALTLIDDAAALDP